MAVLSVLSLIFSLKHEEGISDQKVIAENLGIPPKTVKHLEKLLDEYLKTKVGLSKANLENICPNCLESKAVYDGETGENVCVNCGMVLNSLERCDESLPFDTTYALTSDLAYDKSLGGTLNPAALMRVIAKSPAHQTLLKNGNPHLGLRASILKVAANSFEPPALKKALAKAAGLSAKYGLEWDKLFNHALGRTVRKAYSLAAVFLNNHASGLAETCFFYTLLGYGRRSTAERFLNDTHGKLNRKVFNGLLCLSQIKQTLEASASANPAAFHVYLYMPLKCFAIP